MKKLLLLAAGLAIGAMCFAQTLIPVSLGTEKNATEIVENTSSTLKFTSKLSNFTMTQVVENGEPYSKILADSYITNNQPGLPQLPVIVKMIEVPMGAEIVSKVVVNSEQAISLAEIGSDYKIVPCQPSVFKSQKKEDLKFVKDRIYDEGGYFAPEILTVEEAGIMRGIRLVKVIVNPFAYDIADNALTIHNDISVELSFRNADTRSTEIKNSKYSPAFAAMYSNIWNYKQTRNAEMHYPIKYVIISDRMFEETLQPFIAWKTKKGFDVVVKYTDEVGRTCASINTYLKDLYDAATETNPAPTYLLLVGDTAQISVTWSKLSHSSGWTGDSNDHYTDVYKVCFDGTSDYIPDMFFGRFSAQNISQLVPQIEKTLMFEQYTFPDPAYLEKTVLVAGYDGTYQFDDINGNGQINYATQYYLNEAHNTNVSTYLSPASHTSGDEIKSKISDGVGFVNYSAHCDYDGWQDPSFNLTDIPNLQNDGEYFFSIGNCCLSNKFDKNECFGESLLRTPGKGAVCHIGGTNSTIWDEDFYWAVGVMSPINVNPTYEATTQAAYDHLFHENGETPNVSAGEMVFVGNFSVNSSTSSFIQYYWEIYTLMGDPSLMPYVGIPTQLNTDYSNIIPVGSTSLTVNAESLSYIALSKNGVLLDAQYTGNGNTAELTFPEITESGELDLVITRQFRAPHIHTIIVVEGTSQNDAAMQSIIAPSTALSVQDATFAPQVSIMNIGTEAMTSATVSYTINGGTPVTTSWTGNLAQYEATNVTFDEITLESGNYAFEFTVSQPNGQQDGDPSNNSKTRNVIVSSGNVTIISVSEPNGEYCGYPQSEPTIKVKNNCEFTVTSIVASYTCGELSAEKTFEVNIGANGTADLTFDPVVIPEGEGSISFVVRRVNGGENETQTPKNATFDIKSHDGGSFRLNLLADYNTTETSWDIRDANNRIRYSGNAGNSFTGDPIITDFCLGSGCYTFNLYDTGGDGLAGFSFYGMTFAEGSAQFINLNNNETLLSVDGTEAFSTKTIEFCVEGTTESAIEKVSEVSVFPNPSNGMLNVVAGENINTIEIINGIGETVVSRNVSADNASIDMSALANGIYFARINAESGVKVVKVILER